MPKPTYRLANSYRYGTSMIGNVYGHPKFPDGKLIKTSTVVNQTDTEIETLNSVYVLADEVEG